MLLDIKIGVFASSGKEYLAVEVFSSAMIVFFQRDRWEMEKKRLIYITSRVGVFFFLL